MKKTKKAIIWLLVIVLVYLSGFWAASIVSHVNPDMYLQINNKIDATVYLLTTTSISKILADSRNYEGKEVSVHGTVESAINLGFVAYYVLNDGTGTVYVITEKAVPKVGEVVKVKGIFNQRVKIGNLQVDTITEKF